jgi:hypothetical protein
MVKVGKTEIEYHCDYLARAIHIWTATALPRKV